MGNALFNSFFPYLDDYGYCNENDAVYVHQASTWDCGLACTTMALNWGSVVIKDPMCVTTKTPLWTIELFLFLKERNMNVSFSTSVKGMNENHSQLQWYKDHINDDRLRVEEKFDIVKQNDWKIENEIKTAELIDLFVMEQKHRESKYGQLYASNYHYSELAAIVLVNNRYLDLDPRNSRQGKKLQDGYAGHYIFMLGVSMDGNDILYLDPAKNSITFSCHKTYFEQSRNSPGTDMDLLLLKRKIS
jgi:hypothetical protein